MKMWRERFGGKREVHHQDGRYLIRQIHLLTTVRARGHLTEFCATRDPKALEKFQTMQDLDRMVRRVERVFRDEQQR